ncbi:MAG: sigma factor-like helix-turn-helix DNA-binding protein, partial [Cyanobacteria bacterium P01_H01_bin.119]
SPPLWCYVERALDRLEPTQRLMVVMAKTFRWSETRIAAYLQAEGEQLSPGDVKARLQFAYQALEAALPKDIQVIYLGAVGSEDLASEAAIDPELETLLSPVAL